MVCVATCVFLTGPPEAYLAPNFHERRLGLRGGALHQPTLGVLVATVRLEEVLSHSHTPSPHGASRPFRADCRRSSDDSWNTSLAPMPSKSSSAQEDVPDEELDTLAHKGSSLLVSSPSDNDPEGSSALLALKGTLTVSQESCNAANTSENCSKEGSWASSGLVWQTALRVATRRTPHFGNEVDATGNLGSSPCGSVCTPCELWVWRFPGLQDWSLAPHDRTQFSGDIFINNNQ